MSTAANLHRRASVYYQYRPFQEPIDLKTFLERFNEDFFRKAVSEDSLQRKELKAYWELDKNHIRQIHYNAWFPLFRETIRQARETSLQR